MWILVVPIAAKLFRDLEDPLTIQFFGREVSLRLDLPFSWYCFYFAAVAFSIASASFSIACPEPIKRFRSFSQFYQGGYGVDMLAMMLYEVSDRWEQNEKFLHRVSGVIKSRWEATHKKTLAPKEFSENVDFAGIPKDKAELRLYISKYLSEISREELADVFNVLVSICDQMKTKFRLWSAFWYAIGFVLLLIVFGQNFLAVIQLWLAR